jgi:hypothetical protein
LKANIVADLQKDGVSDEILAGVSVVTMHEQTDGCRRGGRACKAIAASRDGRSEQSLPIAICHGNISAGRKKRPGLAAGAYNSRKHAAAHLP